MSDPSTIYFPLRSNAAALFAGPGVAGVRRRILAAALLTDRVVLESGFHMAWAGPSGGSSMTSHGERSIGWQTARARGRATGARHWVGVRPSDAPDTAPLHPMVVTDADFSWRATFEPFRRELPASASRWLDFGAITDEGPVNELVRGWESRDRITDFMSRRTATSGPASGHFVRSAMLKAGYFDLAVAALTGSGVSMDRRHSLAVAERLRAGDAQRLGGHYALEVLLPTDFTWTDVPGLRKHAAIRDYRAIMREIESAAIGSSESPNELDDRVRREYDQRLVAAAKKGVPLSGRVALQAIGFVVGAVADASAPLVGGAVATTAAFAVGEGLDRAMRPRWLAIDRRLRGTRNGL